MRDLIFKKGFALLFAVIILSLAGCERIITDSSTSSSTSAYGSHTAPDAETLQPVYGVWLSCYDMSVCMGYSEKQFSEFAQNTMLNIKSLGFNTVFCHFRAFGDAFYRSKYFPFSDFLTGTQGKDPGYDPGKILVSAAKENGLAIHAWVNPYRMSRTNDTSKLSKDNVVLTWLSDNSGRAVAIGDKIYLNPASRDAQALVINGVKEILENYEVDGIQFDDYFYPTTEEGFDKASFENYINNSGCLDLDDWRRANVNALVSAVWKICKNYGKSFGISPSAHISTDKSDKNYTSSYADIPLWMSQVGYIDYIIPQLYFGYEYVEEDFCFDSILKKWCALPRHSDLKIYIGLAGYKIGTESEADGNEWCDSSGALLSRQALDVFNEPADGIALFSYSSLVSDNPLNRLYVDNLTEVITSE